MFFGNSLESLLDALTFGGGGDEYRIQDLLARVANATTGAHYETTWLDISGPGILMYMYSYWGRNMSVQLDGGPIYRFKLGRQAVIPSLPFKTSCVVKSDFASDHQHLAVALVGSSFRGDLADLTPVPSYVVSAHLNHTVIDITGSGVFTGALSELGSGNAYCIQADDKPIIYMYFVSGNNFLPASYPIAFESRLKITANSSQPLPVAYLLR